MHLIFSFHFDCQRSGQGCANHIRSDYATVLLTTAILPVIILSVVGCNLPLTCFTRCCYTEVGWARNTFESCEPPTTYGRTESA